MSTTALKDLGYSGDCRVTETDHLLVEMLQYRAFLGVWGGFFLNAFVTAISDCQTI